VRKEDDLYYALRGRKIKKLDGEIEMVESFAKWRNDVYWKHKILIEMFGL
jgi:hypothetical protein